MSGIQRWAYDGVVLGAAEGGRITLGELKEFVSLVERLGMNQTEIVVHAYGLRATRITGTAGPHLDWRDWD